MNTKLAVIWKCLWPACLMGFFIPGVLPVNCNMLHVHLSRVVWQNLILLSTMSKSFPLECLRDRKAFVLPQEILSYPPLLKRGIKEVFYEMSMLTFNILASSTFQPTWDKKYLKQFQAGLDWQLQCLKQCLEEEKKEMEESKRKHPGAMVFPLSNLELRRYFHSIGSFLKDKNHSRCAWEIIRVEIRRCFSYFEKLTPLLRRK